MYFQTDPTVIALVVITFIIAFILAFAIGANDVANSFGTTVGSGVLSLLQACVLAGFFELIGSIFLSEEVSKKVRYEVVDVGSIINSTNTRYNYIQSDTVNSISPGDLVVMICSMSALTGSAIWLVVATIFGLPISGTHSIVGTIVGYGLVILGFSGVKWTIIGSIVLSWLVSPILSGMISSFIYFLINRFILIKSNSLERGFNCLPFFYGGAFFINIFSILMQTAKSSIELWLIFVLSIVISLVISLLTYFVLTPWLRKKIASNTSTGNWQVIPSISFKQLYNKFISKVKPDKTSQEIVLDKVIKTSSIEVDESVMSNDLRKTNYLFTFLQIIISCFGALAHGGNDVSNSIGLLINSWVTYKYGSLLKASGHNLWLMFYGGIGIVIGLFVLGRKVMKTMGKDLSTITPSSGLSVEIGSSICVLLATNIGFPISTTHCKVGSVVAVGIVQNGVKNVDWKLFRNIVLSWLVTVPISAGLCAAIYAISKEILL